MVLFFWENVVWIDLLRPLKIFIVTMAFHILCGASWYRKTSCDHTGHKSCPISHLNEWTILFSLEHCFLHITDLCSSNLIGSPWSCSTGVAQRLSLYHRSKQRVYELCVSIGKPTFPRVIKYMQNSKQMKTALVVAQIDGLTFYIS